MKHLNKRLRTFLLIVLALAATFTAKGSLSPAPEVGGVTVKRVVDGDTLVLDDGQDTRVRLIGVDTPETVKPRGRVEPWGKEASDFSKKSLTGKAVFLEYDEEKEDHYGRTLAYVWTEDPRKSERPKEEILYNYQLVASGYARERAYEPNTKYQALLHEGEIVAMDHVRGIWAVEGKEGPAKGSKKSKIYHLPSDKSYNKVSPQNAIMFENAMAAERAGYRRTFSR
ncbi:thermonuclease family protein [Peptoniphilus sp. HCN-40583]|uniref:thermonuclease family protein n=1 Tax=Peptoniphilus sp. HCN-40583 TaxID=3134662 RepID=UPI0030EBA0F9